ncbi:MAG TPA: TRAP transporter substrate-binding protein DctP [Stellaceae bacterium]|jgi:TRAP-type C4-dicarboxylate transport system substrate-binding protein
MRALALAVFAALLLVGAARADEPVTLRFAIPGSGTFSPTWSQMLQPWINAVEADSGGTLKLQPFFGNALADLFNVYDRIVSGAADLGSGVQGSIGGKFPGSSVVELPSDIGGRDGAAAFWKLYQDGLIAPEYVGVKVIALFVYPQSFLNANKPVARLEDAKGLRFATLTKADARMAQLLGGAPLSTNPAEVYGILQHHGADGVIIGWLGLVGFKLDEVTDHHLVAGLGSGGGFILMNKDAYAKLPPAAKAAIDKHSGYAASRDAFGAALDRIYANSEKVVRGLAGQTIATLAPADNAAYQKALVAPLNADWQKTVPNGAAIFAAYRAEAARVRAEPSASAGSGQ